MAALRKAAHHGRVISNLSQSRFYTVKVASSSPRAHDRPYLDGIEYPIIKSVSTRLLTFVSGQIDMIQPYTVTAPLLKDVKAQGPQAICELVLQNIRDLLINRGRPPFDNRDLRRVMALSLDRKAFIDILAEGQGDIGAAMLPPPEGRWSMPPEMVETLPGYGLDVQKNRAEARRIAEALGYRPDRRIAVKVSTRNIATAVNATVVLIDQLKEIYIDGELERIDNALWFPKVMRHDYVVALAGTFKSVDDPDQIFYETYSCGAENNRDGYCNPEIDKLIEVQRWLAEFVAQHQFGAQRAPNWSTRRSLGSAIACATA